ncbi:FHA domain-containing protein FhaB/FipA [Galactobacter valiniphilus]|uniref:FHA domain-containing protein FhaB/FipA n=1 Tax=Galactobacter valiniphilus TaxID=2676122 RepID=UPI0037350DAD
MAPLVLTLLRFGFLALVWILVLVVILALRRDLGVGQRTRVAAAGAERRGRKAPAPETPLAPPVEEAPRPASELVVLAGSRAGTVLPLGASPLLLGRAQEANLVLDDDYSSGRHARLFPQGSRWFLEDLGSTNGTFIDDAPLTRAQPVEPGQRIRIGKTVMELRP